MWGFVTALSPVAVPLPISKAPVIEAVIDVDDWLWGKPEPPPAIYGSPFCEIVEKSILPATTRSCSIFTTEALKLIIPSS